MDEKSMIIEQERQQKAKKRKKYKKWKWISGILVVVLIVGSVWYMVQGRYLLAASKTTEVAIVVTENQTITYAHIESINGNEITYRITEEPVDRTVGVGSSGANFDASNMPEGMEFPEGMELPEGMEMPEGFNGEMPEGGFGGGRSEGGSRPEGMNSESGETPTMGNRGPRGETTDGQGGEMPAGQRGDMSAGKKGEMPSAQGTSGEDAISEEKYTTYIPVGTDVTTKLGTVTTFSRLAAGDTVALVMETVDDEQVIVAVYIVG